MNVFYPLIRTCAYQGVKIFRFSENLACFVVLLPPFWDSPFCHITDEFAEDSLSKTLNWWSPSAESDMSLQFFKRLSSTNYTWSILEYFVSYIFLGFCKDFRNSHFLRSAGSANRSSFVHMFLCFSLKKSILKLWLMEYLRKCLKNNEKKTNFCGKKSNSKTLKWESN